LAGKSVKTERNQRPTKKTRDRKMDLEKKKRGFKQEQLTKRWDSRWKNL
jgi:hypothetical protein